MGKIFYNIFHKLQYIYGIIFSRPIFYKFNLVLYTFALRGLGIQNYEDDKISGENFLIKKILKIIIKDNEKPVLLDVGGNIGNYSIGLRKEFPNARIISFEPQPMNFKLLSQNTNGLNIEIENLGLGESNGILEMYDYNSNFKEGSQHATFVKGVIEGIHNKDAEKFEIEIKKLDEYLDYKSITDIDFIKIDTEGFEKNVILGGLNHILKSKIIHIEFNEMNIYQKVFLKDFYDLLSTKFNFYRLLPSSLLSLGNYSTNYEIFKYQNIVLINKAHDKN